MREKQGNKKDCLVSAIVSVYNAGNFIRGCLEDLVNQTISDRLEIIVVDSASQQNEGAVVREFQQHYDNIVYIRTEERETIYAAWNRGIKVASGKYITNANADDRHRKDALEIMAEELENDPDTALVFGDQMVTEVGNETMENCTPAGYFKWPDYDRVQLLHASCIGPQPMWRRSLHEEFGGFDGKLRVAGDYEWWLRISEKYQFKHIPEVLGLYLLTAKGVEHANRELCNSETLAVRGHYLQRAGIRLDYGKYRSNFLVSSYRSGGMRRSGVTRNSRPMVSVIVPTYNRPEQLASALRSILAQEYEDFEVIVVNDGGCDVKSEVMKLAERCNATYLEHSRNKGVAAARNSGIRRARGKYIAYLDDDDVFYSNHLDTLVGFLEATGYKVAYSNSLEVIQKWNGGEFETVGKRIFSAQDFDSQGLLVKNCIPTLNVVHRKDCIEETGLFDEDLYTHEDWDLWIRMSRKFRICHIKTVTAEFRTRIGSSSLTSSGRRDLLRTMQRIHSRYSGLVASPDIKTAQVETVRRLRGSIDRKIHVTPMTLSRGPDAVVPKTTVVVSAIGGREELNRLLGSLRSQRRLRELEIIVLEFFRGDGLISACRDFDVRIIDVTGVEFDRPTVCRSGLAESKGELVLFTTDNTLPVNSYWLYKMVSPFMEYPELSALSSRRFVKPDADLFDQWASYMSARAPLVLNSDLIYSLSGDSSEVEWSIIDNRTKRGLVCFDPSSFCIRRDVLGELLKSGEEMDFAMRLLGMGKPVGYLDSTGVYHLYDGSAADVLKRCYVETRRRCLTPNDDACCTFDARDIRWERVRADITGAYCLVGLSLAETKGTETGPVTAIRSFINAFRQNADKSPGEMVKALKEREFHGDDSLADLLEETIGGASLDPEEMYDFRRSVLLSDFLQNFKEFSEYLCSRHVIHANSRGDIRTSVFKILAKTAAEILGAFYLEAESLNRLTPELRRIDRTLGRGVCYF